jgi:hypothetical protein
MTGFEGSEFKWPDGRESLLYLRSHRSCDEVWRLESPKRGPSATSRNWEYSALHYASTHSRADFHFEGTTIGVSFSTLTRKW